MFRDSNRSLERLTASSHHAETSLPHTRLSSKVHRAAARGLSPLGRERQFDDAIALGFGIEGNGDLDPTVSHADARRITEALLASN